MEIVAGQEYGIEKLKSKKNYRELNGRRFTSETISRPCDVPSRNYKRSKLRNDNSITWMSDFPQVLIQVKRAA